MSKLSFETFCLELYSNHSNKPSNEVYLLFKKEGILDLLENDYKDLHGMGMEYLMQVFENCLEGD